MERIKCEDIKPFSTESGTFPENRTVQRLEDRSELFTGIAQLTKDIHPSLRCRLCATPDKDMTDIFSPDTTGKNILEMINHCLPVTVEEGDALPRGICSFCLGELERCYRFHETVVKAEKQLLALVEVESIKLEETEKNGEIFQLFDTQRGLTENNNIDGSFQATSVVEMCNSELPTVTEEAEAADTTVNRDVLLSSLRPCSVVLSRTEVYYGNSSDAENERKKSPSNSELRNPDPTAEAIDSRTTTALEVIRGSICGFVGTRTNYSGSVDDGEDILILRSGKRIDYKADPVVYGKVDTVNQRSECTLCAKVYLTNRSLALHYELAHTHKRLHACEYCGKKFTCRTAKDRHCVIHTKERPFECTICKNNYGWAQSLKEHAKIHSNERNYACSVCDKSFKTSRYRKAHILSHSNEKPWECDYCKKNFRTKSYMQLHIKRNHSLYTSKKFTCEYCEKNFASRCILIRHMKNHASVHLKERNYACSVCDKFFKRDHNLKKHVVLHSNERPWECDHCKIFFKRKQYLQRHIKKKHSPHAGKGFPRS